MEGKAKGCGDLQREIRLEMEELKAKFSKEESSSIFRIDFVHLKKYLLFV